MPLKIEETFRDRYKIIKRLGEGGFGITYLAKDNQLPNNSYCVIKEIPPSPHLSLAKNRERFEYEANALYTLGSHSQIPQLFARFEENEKFYLVQEYIDGESLQAKINSGYRFNPREIIDFLLDVLEVLKFVHQHNRIHRDLKPANLIQRKEDGKIVLIDFGAVKEITTLEYTETGQFQSTVVIGAPGYMPPEQFARSPKYNSDLYALGITAIRAMTGLFPPTPTDFDSQITNSMRVDCETGEIIWRELLDSNSSFIIDRQLEAILNKMILYNFQKRYQNATEVINAIEQAYFTDNSSEERDNRLLVSRQNILAVGVFSLIAGALLMKLLPNMLFAPPTKDYKINFTEVCNSPVVKGEQFRDYRGVPEYITFESIPIWAVFNWKCIFSSNEEFKIIGIELNKYCEFKYRETNYKYEAYFKNYLDKNSWYCTNVGTKLENN